MTTRTASIGGLTWETAALWSGGVVPGAQDDAVLVAGASVGLTGRDTVNTLAIDNGASLSISGLLQATNGVVLAGTLTLAGTLQNTALTAFGNNATLVVAQATLTGTSQISVGFGATLALVKSDVNAYPQLGSTIHVASGTLDLTQYKGIPSFSVTMDDGAATLVVDGLNGGSIYGFRPGDAIDFAPRSGSSASGQTAKPTVTKLSGGGTLVTANGLAYTLQGASADATYNTVADGKGGYLLTMLSSSAGSGNVITSPNGVCGFVDATSGQQGYATMDAAAAGGPAYLQAQYIYAGADSLALSTTQANVFLHGGAGNDAIQVTSGQNVLDGGLGSNFLTGGSGTDTFFTDARGGGTVWNTIRNFHAGDAATLWGFIPGSSTYSWDAAVSGATDSQGATLRATIVDGAHHTGGVLATITFAGLTVDQAKGLQIVSGSQAAGTYLYIYNPGV